MQKCPFQHNLKKEISGPREDNNSNSTHTIYCMEKGTNMVNFQIV